MSLIQKSLQDLKGNWNIALLVATVVAFLPGMFNSFNITIGLVIMLLISGPLRLGYAIFNLKLIAKKPLSLQFLQQGFFNFKSSLGVYLLVLLFSVLGLFLFIIPGLIIMIRLSMSYFILAQHPELEPLQVLERSNRLMKGKELQFIGQFFLLLIPIFFIVTLVLSGISFAILLLIPINTILNVALANFYKTVISFHHQA